MTGSDSAITAVPFYPREPHRNRNDPFSPNTSGGYVFYHKSCYLEEYRGVLVPCDFPLTRGLGSMVLRVLRSFIGLKDAPNGSGISNHACHR